MQRKKVPSWNLCCFVLFQASSHCCVVVCSSSLFSLQSSRSLVFDALLRGLSCQREPLKLFCPLLASLCLIEAEVVRVSPQPQHFLFEGHVHVALCPPRQQILAPSRNPQTSPRLRSGVIVGFSGGSAMFPRNVALRRAGRKSSCREEQGRAWERRGAATHPPTNALRVHHELSLALCNVHEKTTYEACNLSNRFGSLLCGSGANFYQSLGNSKEATFVFHIK